MAKTKTPFFGLGAHGTIGDAITSQKRNSSTLLRSKPTPTDRYTLPQAYQRWLYEDYAYLWRQQSAATQAEYRSAGVRHHLTGFQYWMKYNLTNLPDIAGWWRLDQGDEVIAHDYSRYQLHGAVLGPTPVDGLIGRALYFDGINDRVEVPYSATHAVAQFTLEALVTVHKLNATQAIIDRFDGALLACGYLLRLDATNAFLISARTPGFSRDVSTITLATLDNTYHIATTANGSTLDIYLNGLWEAQAGLPGDVGDSLRPLSLGRYSLGASLYANLTIHNSIVYSRACDPTEILRHSLRRYPA